jgi:hypothetical protein
MARLTDTRLVILSTASRRNDRGVDLPANVTAEAVARPWISSSALGCWKRSAPMARCWPGDAMLKLDPWRFASPSRALKRSGSRMLRWARLRRQALAGSPTGPKSKHLQSKSSPPASELLLQRRRPFARSIRRARRRPKLAPRAKAGRGRNKRACSHAGPSGGSDDCSHHARHSLAAALGARLLRWGSAQEARPQSALGEGRR